MASSVSGQEEAISVFWLATQAGPFFFITICYYILFYYNANSSTSTSTSTNLPLHYNKPNANKFWYQKFLKSLPPPSNYALNFLFY